jgi:endonuclease V-like protein UPF0215 family
VVKPEIRVVGIDDGVFTPKSKCSAIVVGVVFRGGYWLDGVMHTWVRVDGFDATNKIADMILGSPHRKQLRVIMLYGITFGGFNIVDIKRLYKKTGLPVIAVTREKPDLKKVRKALENLSRSGARWKALLNAGETFEVAAKNEGERVFIWVHGISIKDAFRVVRLTSTRSNVPEALRVAHLVASGVSAIRV